MVVYTHIICTPTPLLHNNSRNKTTDSVCTQHCTPVLHVYRYETLLLICAVMGLFDGCFVTLVGPIAFDLCGPQGASQAIGSLLGLFSIPMTTGPPVAGIIYDKVASV